MRPILLLKLKAVILLLCLMAGNLLAQRKAMFNGKEYLVYPARLDSEPYSWINTNFDRMGYSQPPNIYLPPVLDSIADGNYLIYFDHKIRYRKKFLRNRRHSEIIIDSLLVYGTFEIKKGRKNGYAFIFDRWKQVKPQAKLHYKDDVLDGMSSFFTKENGRFKYILDISYKDGIMEGITRGRIPQRKDTVTVNSMTMKNGMADGAFVGTYYWLNRRWFSALPRIHSYRDHEGQYIKGKKQGIWTEKSRYWKNSSDRYYYVNDTLTRSEWFDNITKKPKYFTSYGKDSIMKYIKAISVDTLMLNLRGEFAELDITNVKLPENMIGYHVNPDNSLKLDYYILDDHATRNLYNSGRLWNYRGHFTARDTVINGFTIRTWKIYKGNELRSEMINVIRKNTDTMNRYYYAHPIIFETLQERNFKRGREKERKRYAGYNYYFLQDSVTPAPYKIRTRGKSAYTSGPYYQKALDFEYHNVVKLKRGKLSYARYYEVSGNKANGSIIQYVKLLRRHCDTLTITDTIMIGGQYLTQPDSLFTEPGYKNIKFHEKTNFDDFSTVKHVCIRYGTELYNGNIKLLGNNKRKKVGMMMQAPDKKRNTISIIVYRGKYSAYSYGNDYWKNFTVRNGLLDGRVNTSGLTATFNRNRLDGSMIYDFSALYYGYGSWLKKECSARFIQGKKDGLFSIQGHGAYNAARYYDYIFHNDLYDGVQVETFGTYKNIYQMDKGILHGSAMILDQTGYPITMGNFHAGNADGIFTQYFEGDTFYVRKRCTFKNGCLTGDYKEYSDSHILKLRIAFRHKDSISQAFVTRDKKDDMRNGNLQLKILGTNRTLFGNNVYMDYWFDQLFYYVDMQDGDYTYYYKNGALFKYGSKVNLEPVGEWKFYREGGERIYKRIWFRDSVVRDGVNDTVNTYGITETYYDDGRLMFRGHSLDKNVKYSCESDSEIPVEEDLYLEFYDTIGRPMIVNAKGFITELQANGYKLKEGRIEKNLKQGIWIYYSKFGLPEAVGSYIDGKKTGRWLSGDLSGLNLDERICYMDEQEFKSWISDHGGNLDLTEYFYVDGKMVSGNRINVSKQ